jgi:hypothetical protein
MAFDYTNYRIGGHFLNSKKGNYFPLHNAVKATCCGGVPKELESPVLIDPISNAASQVSYDKHEDVCLAVCSDEELDEGHEDRLEFEATKKLIGLNEYDRLNHKRALIWDECNDQIERYKETNAAPNLTKINRAGVTTRVKKMVEYTSEFSSVALACLQKNAPLSLINAVSP